MQTFSRTLYIVKEEMAKPGTNYLLEKMVLTDSFVFGTLGSSFGRSLALTVSPSEVVFIRFRTHVESSFHGFA